MELHKPSRIHWLWFGELILTGLISNLFDNIYNFFTLSLYNLKEIHKDIYGIIGIIALIIFVIITILLILYYTKYLRIEYRETSITVYKRKNEINFLKFLNKAKKDIHIFGITLEDTSNNYLDLIEDKLKSHEIRKIRVLLVNPSSKLLNEISFLVNSDIGTITSAIKRFEQSRINLGNDGRKLEIRLFDGIPVQSMFILDPESNSDGQMRIEPYSYGIKKPNRRIFEITSKGEKDLFNTYYDSYNSMWNSAKQV